MTIQTRDYQENGLDAIWTYFASGKTGNPLLCWPTGVGKSLIPAEFIKRIMHHWSNQRFLMVTHVKELIKQNAEVMKIAWPEAPLGIYSAGLKQKDIAHPIIFGGIQSMVKNPLLFGHRDLIFIDEAHLISQNESSQYLTFLSIMKTINPFLKVIGLTATPFRMGQGYITDGGLFTDIIHDLTKLDEFNRLIAKGYLAPLIPLRTRTELDVSEVRVNGGEFVANQLQNAVDKNSITYNALREAAHYGEHRHSWLIFASGIEHSNHIADMLMSFGIECASVHSKQPDEYNERAIKAFKSNRLRAIASFSMFTTGFNHPNIDIICDLRPTMSIPLHVQKLGRGTRPANGKENCLVLDFSRNVPRLGPINDPIIPKKKGEKTGDIPVKICEQCGAYNHIKASKCCQCGAQFTFQIKIVAKAGNEDILRNDTPIVETFDVDNVAYKKMPMKEGKPQYLQTIYFCGLRTFKENVFPEHGGYASKLFRNWWRQRHVTEPPITTEEVFTYLNQLRKPKRIWVWVNKKYPEITQTEY